MRRAALLLTGLGALALVCCAAEPDRAPPKRPGATTLPAATPPLATVTRPAPAATGHHAVGTVNVDLLDVAERFGLKATPGDGGKRLTLEAGGKKLVLEVNSREIEAEGLRVFLGTPMISRRGRLYVSRFDFDACLLPLLQPGRAGKLPPVPRVIAIDPGHGGADNGMQNEALGLKEKVLALDVAVRLAKNLEKAGYRVVLTRTDDRTFSTDKKKDLPMRAALANREGADLFVSLHFNSLFPETKTSGTEIYVYTRRGQRSDSSMGFGEEDDTRTNDAPVNRYDAWSTVLAHEVHQALIGRLKTSDRGQKTKHLLVLQDVECPAVLVESVFLSNPAEARLAATPAYREQIAAAIAAGIADYAALVNSLRSKP